jgi:hypothetical protein
VERTNESEFHWSLFQSESHSSLFYGTWKKRPRELGYDHRLRFGIEEITLQMQQAVLSGSTLDNIIHSIIHNIGRYYPERWIILSIILSIIFSIVLSIILSLLGRILVYM